MQDVEFDLDMQLDIGTRMTSTSLADTELALFDRWCNVQLWVAPTDVRTSLL